MARVTVAIPTYDRPAFLKQAIQSVLRQTYQDFDVIVSDDGSNPETAEVVRSAGDPRFRYRRTAGKLGVPKNFNECVRIAQGEFFALLPDDDLYAPEYLERMVQALESNPAAGFAQAGFYAVDQDIRCIEEMLPSKVGFTASAEDAMVWQLQTLRCNPVALVYRRSACWPSDCGARTISTTGRSRFVSPTATGLCLFPRSSHAPGGMTATCPQR